MGGVLRFWDILFFVPHKKSAFFCFFLGKFAVITNENIKIV
jgi:hypothetical protein